jgi:hypothetical protein
MDNESVMSSEMSSPMKLKMGGGGGLGDHFK